jgi:hypothetical protein
MRRIAYRLPRYPMQERTGQVQREGPDGLVVENDETKLEERVRHRDVIRDLDGDVRDEVMKSLGHGFMAYATGDTLRNIASEYSDQYAPGHPANLDASQCDWHYDPAFAMANLPGTPEEWIAYNNEQGRSLGFVDNPRPIIVVQGTDGHHYIWDGNHRTGEAFAAGWTHLPAIVGESRIRDDQPEPDLPPGSTLRSGLRKSVLRRERPLVLLSRGHRLDYAVRMQATTLMKALPPPGRPSAQPQIPQPVKADQPPVLGQWPLLAQPRYAPEDWVQYQRPDMPAPGVGKVVHHGAEHGTYVAPDGGAGRHKVRWESIQGKIQVGVAPEERRDAAATLARMGVPVDPLEHVLLPDRAERPNPHLLARLQALVADGAPIDPAAAKSASAAALRRAIEHFAGPLPREEEQRPYRPTMRPSARLTPWAEE